MLHSQLFREQLLIALPQGELLDLMQISMLALCRDWPPTFIPSPLLQVCCLSAWHGPCRVLGSQTQAANTIKLLLSHFRGTMQHSVERGETPWMILLNKTASNHWSALSFFLHQAFFLSSTIDSWYSWSCTLVWLPAATRARLLLFSQNRCSQPRVPPVVSLPAHCQWLEPGIALRGTSHLCESASSRSFCFSLLEMGLGLNTEVFICCCGEMMFVGTRTAITMKMRQPADKRHPLPSRRWTTEFCKSVFSDRSQSLFVLVWVYYSLFYLF